MDKDIDLEKRYYPVKFKIKEDLNVLKFAAIQTNFADAVRYLIEKEIAENGIRNLSNVIPQTRTQEYFRNLLSSKNNMLSSEVSVERLAISSAEQSINKELGDYFNKDTLNDDNTKVEEKKLDEVEEKNIDEENLTFDDIPECYR